MNTGSDFLRAVQALQPYAGEIAFIQRDGQRSPMLRLSNSGQLTGADGQPPRLRSVDILAHDWMILIPRDRS